MRDVLRGTDERNQYLVASLKPFVLLFTRIIPTVNAYQARSAGKALLDGV